MTFRTRAEILGALVAALAITVLAVHSRRLSAQTRQLQGQLTAREQAFQASDLAHGMTQARLAPQSEVQREADALAKAPDPGTRTLAASLADKARKTNAKADSVTQATFRLQETTGGSVTPPSPATATAGAIPYDFRDPYGRFHLTDPDVLHPGRARLDVDQHFRLRGVILRQRTGLLKAEQLELQEVVPKDGGWTVVGDAKLESATFDYASEPAGKEPAHWFDPHLVFEIGAVGTIAPPQAELTVGAGAMLLRWQDFGLAAVGYTGFRSLSGTGAAVQAYWRPRWGDAQFNVALAAGVGLGLDLQAHPFVGVMFVAL